MASSEEAHIAWAFSLFLLQAASNATASTPLFASDTLLETRLAGPIAALIDAKHENKELPFTLAVAGDEYQVRVRARGHSRIRVCEFAPLRLNFSSQADEQNEFSGQDKLKLVTHCRNNDRSEQDVLEEYAAYRILNIITDAAYKVRLLRMKYQDTGANARDSTFERFAFLIESETELAERLGAKPAHKSAVPRRMLDEEQAATAYVFQYLIANTDWSLVKADYDEHCCHNIDLFEKDARLILVPYDFDLAGLVNARYAYPDPSLRIGRVTRRLYRGTCMERDALRAGLHAVMSKREEILSVIATIPGFSGKAAASRRRFLGNFFERAEDEGQLLRSFEKRCK